jgi:dGTPase
MSNDVINVFDQLNRLNSLERSRFSPDSCFSDQSVRRKKEQKIGYRQQFALDADRILHSRSYTRYIDKTQVFCLITNDHITHRVLHVQLVSRAARTIGRFLNLNEDLIEAIALGHDIGHPPFGHDGEHILSELCLEQGLPPFQHNIQSVRFLDRLERRGRGWNLSVQTLDGILCHDGEIHNRRLTGKGEQSFAALDEKIALKQKDPKHNLLPMTLEGCVVRLADTVSYIGRDIEDAIILGLITRDDLPTDITGLLGETNGSIVYNLVTDLIANSHVCQPGDSSTDESFIGFSNEISAALHQLKRFNYENIYLHPKTKQDLPLIRQGYRSLFSYYLNYLHSRVKDKLQVDLMLNMGDDYLNSHSPAEMVRDYMAGMTDDFFLKEAARIGCTVPVKRKSLD